VETEIVLKENERICRECSRVSNCREGLEDMDGEWFVCSFCLVVERSKTKNIGRIMCPYCRNEREVSFEDWEGKTIFRCDICDKEADLRAELRPQYTCTITREIFFKG
jgi:hypothetical protein